MRSWLKQRPFDCVPNPGCHRFNVTVGIDETEALRFALGKAVVAVADALMKIVRLAFEAVGGRLAVSIAPFQPPEAAGDIKGNALVLAAFVEGVALFAAVIGLMLAIK